MRRSEEPVWASSSWIICFNFSSSRKDPSRARDESPVPTEENQTHLHPTTKSAGSPGYNTDWARCLFSSLFNQTRLGCSYLKKKVNCDSKVIRCLHIF